MKCVLSGKCKLYKTEACNNLCPHFIALYGLSKTGGRCGNSQMPKDYTHLTLSNSPVRDSQPKIYATLDKYAITFERQFSDEERIKSLYLWSESPGNGKTSSSAALLNEYITAHYLGSIKRGIQPLQLAAYFLDVNELQTFYNEFTRQNVPKDIAEKASREYYRRLTAAKQAPFAVYDDIGVRTATEGFRGDLHSSINHRTANAMPTVYTSNLPIEEMAQVFDARLYDRMRDMCAVLPFGGESRRGRR